MNDKERSLKRIFVRDMDAKMYDHEGWLAMVMFGRETLLEDQEMFVEILLNEVTREQARNLGDDKSGSAAAIFARILRETKLALYSAHAFSD